MTEQRAGADALAGVARAWVEAVQALAGGGGTAWAELARAWAGALPGGTAREVFERHLAQGRILQEMGEALIAAQRAAAAGEAGWQEAFERAVAPLRTRMTEILTAGAPGAPGGRAPWEALLAAPPLGYTREWQEKLQRLERARRALEEAWAAYRRELDKVATGTARRFGERLRARAEADRPVGSLRELYDLWVDAAEEAYAEVVAGEDYSVVYGRLVNAMMALRRCQRVLGDELAEAWDLPGRAELDAAHRRVHDLRARVRGLEQALAAVQAEVAALKGPARARGTKVRGRAGAKKKEG
ncbi:poly(R)-hydroxyalkanoic acid synthase subunit PhaE [Inmirania thermothiophila]|uniref:Poly(3-hydroxyalkanoate) polymerase subunit PhaE n=1 Tax=Inmirania thermothiophila TaxID=1750597 RepID=A0A3N1Y8H2_9GAMM|nr:poly(R)-hydroxyalkanoic acid synthase subunit PhaE [Inmirania thermothiophila]ROR35060.1 class III poly(R)-hydroxyalkanoic acid synthase PhaE subunit [Inmirania thermothiophila]